MYIYGATVQGSGLSGVEYVASSVIIHPCDYSPNEHPLIADRKSTQHSFFSTTASPVLVQVYTVSVSMATLYRATDCQALEYVVSSVVTLSN